MAINEISHLPGQVENTSDSNSLSITSRVIRDEPSDSHSKIPLSAAPAQKSRSQSVFASFIHKVEDTFDKIIHPKRNSATNAGPHENKGEHKVKKGKLVTDVKLLSSRFNEFMLLKIRRDAASSISFTNTRRITKPQRKKKLKKRIFLHRN